MQNLTLRKHLQKALAEIQSGDPVKAETYIELALAEPAVTGATDESPDHSIVDNDWLAEQQMEEDQLRAQLAKFLAWDKKWDKSAEFMSEDDIRDSEMELDDLFTETRELLK